MQNLYLHCKRTAFVLLVLLVAIMALTTFAEHSRGTEFSTQNVYYAPWFALLWAVMTGCGLVWLHGTHGLQTAAKLRANWHLWLLHGSLAVILLGAGLSALTSESGQVHLRLHTPERAYMTDAPGHPLAPLPFTIELRGFDVDYHSGTTTARDYTSRVAIDGKEHHVSMNNILTVDHVRLYQMSYDNDRQGSILMVRSDPWGQPVTYAGYALLFVAVIALLFAPKGGFRRSLGELRRLSAALALFALAATASAQPAAEPRTLPRATADAFGRLYVSYGGRICPVQTLAQDFCRKVYGQSHYGRYSAEQVVTGWLFWPDDWNAQPLIQVKSRALRNRLDLDGKSSFNDFFLDGYRLGPLLGGGALAQAAAEVDDRVMLIYSLRRGELFKFFPVSRAGQTVWVTPTEPTDSAQLSAADRTFVTNIFTNLFTDAVAENWQRVDQGIAALAEFQQQHAAGTLPPASVTRAEHLYNAFDLPVWLYRIQLTLGLLLFLLALRRKPLPRAVKPLSLLLLALGFTALTAYMGLRTYVSGRLPLGNGYETMLTVAWFACIVGGWLAACSRRLPILLCSPFLTSGFFLLVASLSQSSAQISQLMPVLNSPLLSLHVSLIMLAYALLSFTFIISLAALVRSRADEAARRHLLTLNSRVVLYPALALLAIGIFVGAIWANQSWGRYWGWDPKEVWALITLIVYALPLHAGSLPRFRSERTYHIYMLCAFATVLMTYFGVNYVLGGLHSYAG